MNKLREAHDEARKRLHSIISELTNEERCADVAADNAVHHARTWLGNHGHVPEGVWERLSRVPKWGWVGVAVALAILLTLALNARADDSPPSTVLERHVFLEDCV